MARVRSAKRFVQAKIRDLDLAALGFSCFRSSSVESQGTHVRFRYPSGAEYRVSLRYLLQWFPGLGRAQPALRADASRTIASHAIVRVFLSNGNAVDVAFDTVLMACEPSYEHFGGLTPLARRVVQRAFAAGGSVEASGWSSNQSLERTGHGRRGSLRSASAVAARRSAQIR